MSVSRIVTYNDKIVLDQEYESIINNINLSKIEDREIIQLFLSLMDSLTESKLVEGDKKWIKKEYEKNVENAIYASFQDGAGLVAGATADVITGNFGGAAKNLTKVGMQYFNYQKMMEEQKDSLDKANWELEKNVIDFLNYQRKKMLSVSWELIQKYNLPDEWRLTEQQIDDYIKILRDDQVDRRFRKLERISDDFQAYPPFWYYYGKAAQDLGNNDFALECYGKYESIRKGIFREDPFFASTCMNRIELLDINEDRDEALRNLKIITEQAKNNNDLDLYCALLYMKLGEYSTAIDLLQKNIDEEYNISLNKRLIGEALLAQKSGADIESLIDDMVGNDSVKNQDIIYLIGKVRYIDKLSNFKDQILGIDLSIQNNMFTKEDISLKIPVKWFFEDLKVSLRYNGELFNVSKMDSDEAEQIVYCKFDNVIDESDLYENSGPTLLTIIMDHPSCPMEIIFKCVVDEVQNETLSKKISENKHTPDWLKKKIEDNMSDTKVEKELSISISQIISGNEKFELENDPFRKM